MPGIAGAIVDRHPLRSFVAPRIALRLLRLAFTLVVVGLVVFLALLVAVRYVVFPNLDRYRDTIATRLAHELGQPVTIGGLHGSWDGWNPRVVLTDLAIHDPAEPAGAALLALPNVQFVVAWTSLVVRDLRLRSLVIERPALTVRRDAQGRFHIGGVEVDVDAPVTNLTFVEWLARQREIVVRDARVVWNDELRGAPPLPLEHVQFRLEQTRAGVRFGLVGSPPPELASPLDLRGELLAGSLGDWRTARGRFYLRLDYADVARWRDWVPVLRPVDAGEGAVRVWTDVAGGVTTAVVADLELTGVRGHVTPKLPQLDLDYLRGRVTWKHAPGRREIVLHDLAFRTRTGQALAPVTMTIVAQESADGRITGGTLAFDRLDAKPLSELAVHLPLPEQVRNDLVALDLRGSVTDGKFAWTGAPDEPSSFSGAGDFAQLGIAANNALPGAEGVSGHFTFDEMRGELKLDSRDVRVRLPQVYADALLFTSASGTVRWSRGADDVRVILDDVKFATPHTAGTARGSWRSQPQGPGLIELRAQLARADAKDLYRYLPLTLHADVRDWLKASIKAGRASDVRMVLAGNLADFPFASARQGQFLVTLKVADAVVDYADGWPPVTGIAANVKFEGAGMMIEAREGEIHGVRIGPATIGIPDLGAKHPALTVTGKAQGPTAGFLGFIAASPIAGWIDGVTSGVTTTGNGQLDLRFTLPLGAADDTKVAGDYELQGNEVAIPGVPTLADVTGHLDITKDAIRSRDLTAALFGGEARIAVRSVDGALRVAADGTADVATLRRSFPHPLLDRVSGSAPWSLTASSRQGVTAWTLTSDLVGVAIALPAPAGKAAAERAALRVERRDRTGKGVEDTLIVDYRSNLRLVAQRQLTAQGADIERALLVLGPGAARTTTAERPGWWVRGAIDDFDLDEWFAVVDRVETPAGESPRAPGAATAGLTLNGVEVSARRLDVFGRSLHDVAIDATRAGDQWRIRTKGREAEGTATWYPETPAAPNGRIVARLSRLVPPGPAELHPAHSEIVPGAKPVRTWPELDIVADAFMLRDHDAGRLELRAQPAGTDWRIDQLALTNASGRIDATGWWRVAREHPRTELTLRLAAEDAGGFLARFGYPVAVRNAPTTINGDLTWAGAPNDFDYPTLTGRLTLATGPGQFTRIDPGIGKLLGVLSLQELPRRITLDFRDVFSEGFAFDRIEGDFAIRSGLMTTDNLSLAGPAAQVTIRGDIDLAQETQKLTVRVKPALSTMFSAGAAVLFLANPIIGAAVGAGTLLAQKLLDNPIDQIFSYEYRVTGPWVDPQVERVSHTPVAAPGVPSAPGAGAAPAPPAAAADTAPPGAASPGATGTPR
ncbi:MAG: TIGR02099 family protein [Burkholderiales bacterium]|nr:TIGR02099 family protein [Burkholderiales bacterium]